jgi:hypothetical protein
MLMLTLMRGKDSAVQDILNETSIIRIIFSEQTRLESVEK